MKKLLLLLFTVVALTACDNNNPKYPTVIRTGLWEVCLVNDSTLMAVPTNNTNGDSKPILFKLSDTETLNDVVNE